jgi:Uri superfamily endonuclease
MKQAIISPQHRQDCKRVSRNLGPGTYILLFHMTKDSTLRVGKLGRFTFPAGYCLYVGSAMGRGGISGRLKHHLSPSEVLHWHIDYLGKVASLEEIWYQESQARQEHCWATLLNTLGSLPVVGFGASDCRCQTHLFRFLRRPRIHSFQKVLRNLDPEAGLVKTMRLPEAVKK